MTEIPILLRFYGRFLFTEPLNPDGELMVIAVNLNANPDVGAGAHDAFMSVPEDRVDLDLLGKEAGRRLAPAHRVMSDGNPLHATQLVWRIGGYKIDVPVGGGFQWQPGARNLLPDIGSLATASGDKGARAEFNRRALDVGKSPVSPTAAVIQLHGGVGSTQELTTFPLDYNFVRFVDPTVPVQPAGRLADMVEVSLMVEDSLTITFFDINGIQSFVTILPPRPPADGPSVVSFSNLCAQSHSGADKEFAGFYEFSFQPPPVGNRLVPLPAILENRPFGDCFIAARISF